MKIEKLKIGQKVGLRDSYKYYKKNSDKPVDLKTYLDITQRYMKFLMSKVFEGWEVVLPAVMGLIAILGRKKKPSLDENGNIVGAAPDWKATNELRKKFPGTKEIIYHFNEHSNNIRYKIYWSKKGVITQNKKFYNLRFSRANKRAAAKKIKEGVEYAILGNKLRKT